MANEKTPLRDTAPSTPQRAQQSANRSTVARRRAVVGIVAAVVLAVGLFFLFGGKDSPIGSIVNSPDAATPTFAFKTVSSGFETTVAQVNKNKQLKSAKQITPAVQDTLTQWMQAGYVDPDTWGDAGAIQDLFTGTAVDQVEPNIETLTLGTTAADTYDSFDPGKSKIKVVALTDGDAQAIRAMAEVESTGKVALTDGSSAKVTVTGTLFLVPDGDTWKIEAFQVRREITPIEPKASASASPTESA